MIQGVDVARYQGSIDWDALSTSTGFALIKATGGCPDPGEPDSKYVDSSFQRNRDEARRSGVLHGFYHYAYPEYNSPEAEAEFFARIVSDLRPGEPVFLDYESSWTGDTVGFCLSWLRKVEQLTGVKPLIYLNLYTTKAHDWKPVIDNGNGLWLAQWTYQANGQYDVSQPWSFAAFMQYSNKGNTAGNPSVNGIPATVDLDVFFGDADSFRKYGKETPAETTTTATAVPVPSTTTTTVAPPPVDSIQPPAPTTTTTTVMPTVTPTDPEKTYLQKVGEILSSPRLHQLLLAVVSVLLGHYGHLEPFLADAIAAFFGLSVTVGTVDRIAATPVIINK